MMRKKPRACLTLVILPLFIAIWFPTTACGEDDEGFESIFESIRSLRTQEQYDEAIGMLEKIIEDNSDLVAVVKRAYTELVFTYHSKGDEIAAEETARLALYRFPDLESDDRYVPQRVGEMLAELRTRMFGGCIVTTSPDSCHIVLDGDSVGYSPLELTLVRAGEHVLGLSKPGYVDLSKSVFVASGSITDVHCSLERAIPGVGTLGESKLGAGFSLGYAGLRNDAKRFGKPGSAITGFGWYAVTNRPLILFRLSIGGVFYNRSKFETATIQDVTYKFGYGTSVFKLVLTAEISHRFWRAEPYVGLGGGFYRVWTRSYIQDLTLQEPTEEEYTGRGGFGVTAVTGLRFWVRTPIALELSAQYDKAPDKDAFVSEDELIRFDYESLTFFIGVNIGRAPRG